ncbi:fimbrial protein [Klebsiella aerogenes]
MKLVFMARVGFFAALLAGNSSASPLSTPYLMENPTADNYCRLSVGNQTIDYGNLSRWQLEEFKGGQQVSPGKRSTSLSVVCPYSQVMSLAVRGDKAANGELRYGGEGYLSIRLSDVQLDGQTVQLVETTPEGVRRGTPAEELKLAPGKYFSVLSNNQLARGKMLSARMEIEPMLPEHAARVSARQLNESSLTLELMN